MTTRFRLGLGLLAALALGCVVLLLASDGDPLSGSDRDLLSGAAPILVRTPDAPLGVSVDPALEGPDGGDPANAQAPHAALVPGLRVPHGTDLGQPQQRVTLLSRLLRAEEIDWQEVGKLLALMSEPVPEDLRAILLDELRTGQRNQVMFAFRALNDPSFVDDLFDVLDDPAVARGARAAALQALWQMPGANRDDVALRLEGRLANDLAKDRDILHAIASRGGLEATRALVQYVLRAQNPTSVPLDILRALDLGEDEEAAMVLERALRDPPAIGALSVLVDLAGRPGASGFTSALIGLDHDGHPPELRARVFTSLAGIGDEDAIDYLLGKADEPGEFGEKAILALRTVSSANEAARLRLARALETAGLNARPEAFKESVILALGALAHAPAVPAIAGHLADPGPRVQLAAVRALGRMKQAASGHTRALAERYVAGDDDMKVNVAIALGSIAGPEAQAVLEVWQKQPGNAPSLQRTLDMAVRAIRDVEEAKRRDLREAAEARGRVIDPAKPR